MAAHNGVNANTAADLLRQAMLQKFVSFFMKALDS